MPKYRVNYQTVATTSYVVEADDEDGALEAAERHDMAEGLPTLCAQCSGWRGPGVDLGEWEPDPEYPFELIEDD